MTVHLPAGRRLVLAGGRLGGLWIALGIAAVVLLLLLYREERKLVPRATGLGLLVLRMLAALVLIGALFEPIAERTIREAARGRVILGVDVSESMTTADPGRSGEERARLIRTLGLPAVAPLDTLPRREVARALIEGGAAPLAPLAVEHDLRAFRFARESAPATRESLADLLKRPVTPGAADAQVTDWEPVLAEALRTTDPTTPIIGVVLLTDGRRNAPGDLGPTLDRLAARGTPIFPVLIGSTRPPVDAAVASLKAPESVYTGDTATVEATLKLDGYAGRDVSITLDQPGAEPQRQTLRAPADGSRPTVAFRVPLNDPGPVRLNVSVASLEGDSRPDNNQRAATIQVADDKARVLLIDGEARWEFRYLRNALARDPRVNVEAVVFRQPRSDLTDETAYTYQTTMPERLADQPDPLGGYDVIVVGDVDPSDMPAEVWSRLDAFVAERGGTLVVAPGARYGAVLLAADAPRKLLPVVEPRVLDIDPRRESADAVNPSLPPGVAFTPTDDALADALWPMLQLATDPEQSRQVWSTLPRMPWMMTGRAKPGASMLATAGDDPSAAALAVQPYGLGKVLWLGIDGTWRWRHRIGDAYHHRFWGQIVRWASTGKLAAGNAFVRFGPRKPRVGEGEPVRIQARVSEGVEGVRSDMLIAARIFRAGGDSGEALAVVPLRATPGQPRTFEGDAPSLPIGAYVVRLDVPGLAEALRLTPDSPEAPLEIVARDTSERVELAAAREPLEHLASATGGRVVADYEAADLPPLLRARTRPTTRAEETPLWDTPGALFLFFGIVTMEWIARKRAGLP